MKIQEIEVKSVMTKSNLPVATRSGQLFLPRRDYPLGADGTATTDQDLLLNRPKSYHHA